MGSVSDCMEETWGQSNSSQQGQLPAAEAETWAGSEQELLPETPWEWGFRHLPAIPSTAGAFSGANPLVSSPTHQTLFPQARGIQAMSHILSSWTSSLGEVHVSYN